MWNKIQQNARQKQTGCKPRQAARHGFPVCDPALASVSFPCVSLYSVYQVFSGMSSDFINRFIQAIRTKFQICTRNRQTVNRCGNHAKGFCAYRCAIFKFFQHLRAFIHENLRIPASCRSIFKLFVCAHFYSCSPAISYDIRSRVLRTGSTAKDPGGHSAVRTPDISLLRAGGTCGC